MAQRFYKETRSVVVQANYAEHPTPTDDLLEFVDEERKAQILSNRSNVNLLVETNEIKQKLVALIKSKNIIPVTSNNGLTICIGYNEYLSLKRYLIAHPKELPIQFEFSENNFPAQMGFGLGS